jgi:hypothetical protein
MMPQRLKTNEVARMTETTTRPIRHALRRVRWRLKAQSALRWSLWAAVVASCALLITVVLYKLWLFPPDGWVWMGVGCGALVVTVALLSLIRRHRAISLAQRLDQSNNLKDRLGTALSLLEKPTDTRTEFENAQIRDAVAHANGLNVKSAAPWAFPREVTYVAVVVGAAWLITLYWPREWTPPVSEAGVQTVQLTALPPIAKPETQQIELTPEEKTDIENRIAENREELAPLAADDPEMEKFIEELNKTLEALAEGKLSDRALAEKAADLAEKAEALEGNAKEQQRTEELTKKFDKLGEELGKEAKKMNEKDIQELAKLIKEQRYEEAARKVEELARKFAKLTPKEKKKLAKLFKKVAAKLQSKLAKKLEKLKKERNRLNRKKEDKGRLSKRERSRLNRIKKQIERLNRRQERQNAGAQKELDRLSRNMRDMANKMRRSQPQKKRNKQSAEQQKRQRNGAQRHTRMSEKEMRELSKALRRMGKRKRRQRLGRKGKMRLADLKELLRRRRGEGRKRLERLARRGKGRYGKGRGGSWQKDNGQDRKGAEWMRVGRRQGDGPIFRRHARIGAGSGQGHRRLDFRQRTNLKGARMRPDFVPGQRAKGPSRREILLGAAAKGSRVTGYGKVHIDYSMRASRQMANEEVPPGYREFVEAYFRLIRKR